MMRREKKSCLSGSKSDSKLLMNGSVFCYRFLDYGVLSYLSQDLVGLN